MLEGLDMVGLKVSVMHGKATKALMLENVTYQTLTSFRDFILETQIFLFVLKGDILERAQFFFSSNIRHNKRFINPIILIGDT